MEKHEEAGREPGALQEGADHAGRGEDGRGRGEADPDPEQVAGQICMELQPAEEQKPAEEPDAEDLQTKMMRFLGGKFGGVEKAEGLIVEKLDKIIDYMAQILRKLDG